MTNSSIGQTRGWKHPLVILIMSLLVLSSFWAPIVYAASTQAIYYFNGYDPGQAWPVDQDGNGPGNMVDDDEWTHSGDMFGVPSDYTQLCNTNTCPGTDLGAIIKVEMGAKIDVYGNCGYIWIAPVFTGGNGTTRAFHCVFAPQGGFTGWFDITSDPNAPSTWDWTYVKNLDVKVRGKHTVSNHDESVYKIWIRVTYTIENVDTYDSAYSSLKDQYIFPGDTVYAKAMGLTSGEAWLPGWRKRVKMMINQSDVSSDLTDFQVLIHLSASSGQGLEDVSFVFDELTSDANRKKIAITTADGIVECPVEIEKWDDANEQAWLWIKVPSVSSTSGTTLYLYYDATHTDNTNNVGDPESSPAQRVWSTYTDWAWEYGGVWHLDETPNDGTPGGCKDSSPPKDSNGYYPNHGTPRNFQDGGGGSTNAVGKIDGGDSFAGDDDYITVPSPSDTKPDNKLTISAWIKISGSISHSGEIVTMGDSYGLRVWPDGRILFYKYNGIEWTNMAPESVNVIDNKFHYIVGTYTSSSGMNLYLDGVEVDSNSETDTIVYDQGNTLEIGRHGNGNPDYNFTGIIDEVHVENIARDATWVKASYESERDHFIDFGSEEVEGGSAAGWLSGWKKRMKMTIDHTYISSSLTNFPVLIYLSSSSGIYKDNVAGVFSEVGAYSKKIAVTKSDGTTQFYVEVEKWDSGSNKAWLWVNVSSVSNTADTILYLYYDSSHANNTAYVGDPDSTVAQKVWDTYFKGVWHLRETSGGTGAIKDSTSNNNDGTNNGPTLGVTGKIDSATEFDGSNDYIKVNDNSVLRGMAQLTIECWANLQTKEAWNRILEKADDTASNSNQEYLFILDNSADQKIGADIFTTNGESYVISNGAFPTNQWVYVVGRYNGATTNLYINGVVQADSDSLTGNIRNVANPLAIGAGTYHISDSVDGTLDEVRISNTARSADWIKASYESGRDHLVDFGSEETRYDIKYYSDWLGTPVLEGSQSNVSESVRGEWRSSYALQAGDPTGTWGVRVYEAGTVTLKASCSFIVVPKVPEFPLGAILPLAVCLSIYLAMRKNGKRWKDLKGHR